MSYDYSENILVQEAAGNLLQKELGWDVKFAYNTEVLGESGTFGRETYEDILLERPFRAALKRLNDWITDVHLATDKTAQYQKQLKKMQARDHRLIKLMSDQIDRIGLLFF